MRPQIVFLNRCYWPDSEATGQLLSDLCDHLSETFDVHVVCGQPNSPTEDYRRVGTQQRKGVMIHRLSHTQFTKRVPAGRLLNIVSFSRAVATYLRRCELRPDVLISETDPFLLPVVAEKHARRIDAKLICYLQDIYPDVAEAIGKVRSGVLTEHIRTRLRAAYQAADRVVVLGDCMRRRLQSPPWSLESDSIDVIPNWSDCQSIKPLSIDGNRFREREGLKGKFVVMHSGNLGLTQRLDVLIQATSEPAWPANAVLLLVGDGAARRSLQKQAAALHSRTSSPHHPILFLPYQSREKLGESLSAADLHVVSMHESITGCLCPSKLYGILAAGRPVLAVADESTDLCQTVTRHRLGWCCQPGDSPAIADMVSAAASGDQEREAAGKRAREIACSHFDRPIVTQQFAQLLSELVMMPTVLPTGN